MTVECNLKFFSRRVAHTKGIGKSFKPITSFYVGSLKQLQKKTTRSQCLFSDYDLFSGQLSSGRLRNVLGFVSHGSCPRPHRCPFAASAAEAE